ncbi:hypothetical protein HVY71_12555 [Citrobacter freundii]|uniref:hypothetical protein n=1 Tax=Citrobacter portucalensis TaxID=1639133 RepID=UPI0015EA4160|nr:hypothetical protein HVY71_12555 [Citrobacter freundii]
MNTVCDVHKIEDGDEEWSEVIDSMFTSTSKKPRTKELALLRESIAQRNNAVLLSDIMERNDGYWLNSTQFTWGYVIIPNERADEYRKYNMKRNNSCMN